MFIKTEPLSDKDVSTLRWKSVQSSLIAVVLLAVILVLVGIKTQRPDAFNMLPFLSMPPLLMLIVSYVSVNKEVKNTKKISYTGKIVSKNAHKPLMNSSSQPRYYINIEGERIMVSWGAFVKAKEGQIVRISLTERSRYFIRLEILEVS